MIVIELIARRSASVKTQLLYKYRSEIGFENHPKMSHFNFFFREYYLKNLCKKSLKMTKDEKFVKATQARFPFNLRKIQNSNFALIFIFGSNETVCDIFKHSEVKC